MITVILFSSTSDIFVLWHEQELDMLTNSFDPFWVSWTCREGDQVSVLTPLARVTSVRPFSCENTAAKEHAKHKRAPWTHLPLLYVYLHGQPGIWISFQGMKYWWDSSPLSGKDLLDFLVSCSYLPRFILYLRKIFSDTSVWDLQLERLIKFLISRLSSGDDMKQLWEPDEAIATIRRWRTLIVIIVLLMNLTKRSR